MTEEGLYLYRAEVQRVVDGDTLVLKFDLGFNVSTLQKCRLDHINAPEHGLPEGKAAQTFLEGLLPVGAPVLVKTRKDKREKYGRVLATVVLADGSMVNDLMVEKGHAKLYDGRGPR